ncbi:uncharacterized protein LOC141804268 [Halichoeres trimaculatus]|uniref:uncharacterized protein LOC141804268 n=1 Tax=Halichoeres trimaculatus TaxID=147232 RepID=UPI003D9F33EE
MFPRRSSRTPKPSFKIFEQSPPLNENVIEPQSSSTRQRTMGMKKSKACSKELKTDKTRDRDMLDIINNTHRAERFFKKDDRPFAEVTDQGLDESDEDCVSVNSSIASGPSMPFQASPKKGRAPQSLCSACHKLYLKAKRMKAPMKDKLLDNNPQSLTCDQWVLIKSWRPKRLLKSTGNLLAHLMLVKRRLGLKSSAERTEQCERETEQSACLKPHIFLQRNLRQCVRVPVKNVMKKNRKKRKREDPRGSRAAKKQRLHSRKQDELINAVQPGVKCHLPTSCSPLEGSSDQEADTMTVDLIPCSVTLETTRNATAESSKESTKSRFGVLLAQLRGNSSMVVRETR